MKGSCGRRNKGEGREESEGKRGEREAMKVRKGIREGEKEVEGG